MRSCRCTRSRSSIAFAESGNGGYWAAEFFAASLKSSTVMSCAPTLASTFGFCEQPASTRNEANRDSAASARNEASSREVIEPGTLVQPPPPIKPAGACADTEEVARPEGGLKHVELVLARDCDGGGDRPAGRFLLHQPHSLPFGERRRTDVRLVLGARLDQGLGEGARSVGDRVHARELERQPGAASPGARRSHGS